VSGYFLVYGDVQLVACHVAPHGARHWLEVSLQPHDVKNLSAVICDGDENARREMNDQTVGQLQVTKYVAGDCADSCINNLTSS